MLQGRRRLAPFKQTIARPAKLGPEHNPWWWNPSRVGVRGGPDDFTKRLKEVDPDLAVTWNPIREQWQIWQKKERIQSPIAQGWLLLFSVAPRSLDERVFHRLYSASSRKWGSAKAYFDRIEAELLRERERREKARSDEARDLAGDYYDFTKIKVSMRGQSSGSKFTNCHSE